MLQFSLQCCWDWHKPCSKPVCSGGSSGEERGDAVLVRSTFCERNNLMFLPWGVGETQLLWQHLEGKVKSNGAVETCLRLATSKLLDIYGWDLLLLNWLSHKKYTWFSLSKALKHLKSGSHGKIRPKFELTFWRTTGGWNFLQTVYTLHPRKLTWQWKNNSLKMHLRLKIVIFPLAMLVYWREKISTTSPQKCNLESSEDS